MDDWAVENQYEVRTLTYLLPQKSSRGMPEMRLEEFVLTTNVYGRSQCAALRLLGRSTLPLYRVKFDVAVADREMAPIRAVH